MGSRPERGAFGNARGKPDKQRRNRVNREKDPRYQAAMAEVRENQELIDRLTQQTAEEAERSAVARSKVALVYERPPLMSVPEPTKEPVAPRVQGSAPGRFVDCWCAHTHGWHQGSYAPQCGFDDCDCPGYRPKTARDPLDPKSLQVRAVDRLIESGKESFNRRTVWLAEKIEGMLLDLRQRVDAEDEEREALAKAEAKAKAARERVAQLEAELRAAREELGTVVKKTAVKKKPAKLVAGDHKCPTCGDVKQTAQGLGAHRARAHGYRKGDDD